MTYGWSIGFYQLGNELRPELKYADKQIPLDFIS